MTNIIHAIPTPIAKLMEIKVSIKRIQNNCNATKLITPINNRSNQLVFIGRNIKNVPAIYYFDSY